MRKTLTLAMVFFCFFGSALAKENVVIDPPEIQVSFHKAMTLDYVIDGDTIVADGKKIRLWGINTPEKNNPYFLIAKMLLESFLSEGELKCKFIEKDRYKRDVMHCLIDGRDIGSMMVQTGMAKDYSKYSGDYYQYEEDLAKAKKMGIWSDKIDKNKKEPEQVMCTMDAKQCPDGSYVSRQAPDCKFSPCPDKR
tara:strand:- start:335 stop:916 length:582 start_codon:yes stop_codon:yes gene_type:complete